MRLMRWQFNELDIPMMEDDRGTLYTTGTVLANALGVTEQNLLNIYQNHRDEFDDVRVSSAHLSNNGVGANDFLQQNRETFGIQRVRQDMHLWTEDDMILFAALSHSDQGKEFRKGMKEVIKQQARKTYISREEYERMVTELLGRITDLERRQQDAQPYLRKTASAAGSALSAQRFTKNLRN